MNIHNIPLWHMQRCWDDAPRLNKWWGAIHKDSDGVTHSNIRIGDFFSLGAYNQFGLVTDKVTLLAPETPPTFQYGIEGDIGGHWHRPMHEKLTERNADFKPHGYYFHFIPSATQLCELASHFALFAYREWAEALLQHYRHYPFADTHRGTLKRLEREAGRKERSK